MVLIELNLHWTQSIPLTWAPSHNPLEPSFVMHHICVNCDLKALSPTVTCPSSVIYSSCLVGVQSLCSCCCVFPVLFCASFPHEHHNIDNSKGPRIDHRLRAFVSRKTLEAFKPSRDNESYTILLRIGLFIPGCKINCKACAVTEALTHCRHFSLWAI